MDQRSGHVGLFMFIPKRSWVLGGDNIIILLGLYASGWFHVDGFLMWQVP